MKRPVSITILALGLAWFAFACTAAAILLLFARTSLALSMSTSLGLAVIVLGMATATAAWSAWQMHPRTPRLLRIVAAAGVLLGAALVLSLGRTVPPSKLLSATVPGAAVFVAVTLWEARRVHRLLGRAA